MRNNFEFLDRRSFLQRSALLAGAALPLLKADVVLAQGPKVESSKVESTQLTTQRLSAKLLFVRGPQSNVLVVDSKEGLILVDGGHADWFDALHKVIAENFPGRPYRALFNTHWHREQTGSNQALGQRGVQIIAHENTQLWESTEVWQRWSKHTFAPLPAVALPKTTFFNDGAIQLGDRQVQYGYMKNAHTDGDIWVYFEDENVLVSGGLVSNQRWPEIDWSTGGFIGAMLDSFVSLLSVPNQNTKIIPAYGDMMTLQELRAQNQMYLNIFDRLHGSFIKSETLEELLRAKPTAEYDAVMGEPTQFLTLAWQSIAGHLRDPQNTRFLKLP